MAPYSLRRAAVVHLLAGPVVSGHGSGRKVHRLAVAGCRADASVILAVAMFGEKSHDAMRLVGPAPLLDRVDVRLGEGPSIQARVVDLAVVVARHARRAVRRSMPRRSAAAPCWTTVARNRRRLSDRGARRVEREAQSPDPGATSRAPVAASKVAATKYQVVVTPCGRGLRPVPGIDGTHGRSGAAAVTFSTDPFGPPSQTARRPLVDEQAVAALVVQRTIFR